MIEFYDGYKLEVSATLNNVNYQFITKDDKKAKAFNDKRDPLEVGEQTNIGREIIKHMEPMNDNRGKGAISKEYEDIMRKLSDQVEEIIVSIQNADKTLNKLETDNKKKMINEGKKFLLTTELPLVWVAETIDWLTAGERDNILYAFLAYASQVVLQEPISVIGIGDGASGKTHVQDVALSLMPDEFVLQMKSSTMAAVYAMSDKDPYYFDGRIVNIGDMGGADDHQEAQEFKNIMKELQTDGYVKRVKTVKNDDGEHVTKDFELYGRPCLTYTNVPGYDYDDQEKSRTIFYQPRVDNDIAVDVFKRLNRNLNTPYGERIRGYHNRLKHIHEMLLALRERMTEIRIENPYGDWMRKYLEGSKYFKRDVDKYDGILRVISAINGYNRPIINGVLYSSKQDIKIFIDILQRYRESITANLTPGATDLLQELRDHADDWDLYEDGISVNEYLYKTRSSYSKRSAQTYFGELNSASYVKVVDKIGSSNVYALIGDGDLVHVEDIEMSSLDKKILKTQWGDSDYEEILYLLSDDCEDINILELDDNGPLWNDYVKKV